MVTGQKSLVKVGSKPGVTKTINFFLLNDKISLAALPGFGYAKLPGNIRKTFLPLIKDYIKIRDNLKLGFLLDDVRREPAGFEKDIITFLSEEEIPTAIIATKCDKLSKNKIMHSVKTIAVNLEIDAESIFVTSSHSGLGRNEVLNLIEEYS